MRNKNFIRNIVISTLTILFVFFIAIFMIKPSIIGYGVYQQMKNTNYSVEDYSKNINEIESKLLISNTNLSSCIFFNNKFSTELGKCLDKFSECEAEKTFLKINYNSSSKEYEAIIKSLEESLEEKNKEISDLNSKSDILVKNLANNFCCKKKIDNPNIDSYILENNKIICLEQGTLKISC